ncbi:hypothetical protein [Azospirillum thermophilum]|uniref:Uncharacterized protein n=1 Tax=Azospirillum thermophilum TaxID=2202148 RepID=A0A2S2CW97_9PROT|nr:hypothetical protein [Azospirillum thermophilum]AWK88804.1 hypothetical protein DEW08_22275 [Azospirillum thermophilum]
MADGTRMLAGLLAGGCLLAAALPLPGPALAGPAGDAAAPADEPLTYCAGAAAGRRCSASLLQPFADNRGGQDRVTLTLTRGGTCDALHIAFDQTIMLDQPVWVAAGGPRLEFAAAGRARPGGPAVAVKEPRQAALGCAATARLVQAARSGLPVRLGFQVAPRGITTVYHWPGLAQREVALPLDRLADALDRAEAAAKGVAAD